MRRSSRRLALLAAACLLACTVAQLPAPVAAESDAEVAAQATIAGDEADIGAAGGGKEQQEDAVDEKDVLVLTDAAFDETIKKHKNVLVSTTL